MVRKIKKSIGSQSQYERILELENIIEEGMKKNLDLRAYANELIDEIEDLHQQIEFLKSQLKKFENQAEDEKKTISMEEPKINPIENKIIEILKENKNISKTELAKKLNISRQALYKSYKHLF